MEGDSDINRALEELKDDKAEGFNRSKRTYLPFRIL
jgi:hypothetical protein